MVNPTIFGTVGEPDWRDVTELNVCTSVRLDVISTAVAELRNIPRGKPSSLTDAYWIMSLYAPPSSVETVTRRPSRLVKVLMTSSTRADPSN